MKVAVGSKNPTKITAVENAVKKVWPDAEIIGIAAASGVREQPLSDDEAIEGATNRARCALREAASDLGVGLEGCTVDTKYGMFMVNWTVIIDKDGKIGLGCGGRILLPGIMASAIRNGEEVGSVMDKLIGEYNTKQGRGTCGVLTNNLIPRTKGLETSVIYALTKFINPQLYE